MPYNAREKLLEEFKQRWPMTANAYPRTIEEIADFIMHDRRRIVKPLVKYLEGNTQLILKARKTGLSAIHMAIDETLKNAGIS